MLLLKNYSSSLPIKHNKFFNSVFLLYDLFMLKIYRYICKNTIKIIISIKKKSVAGEIVLINMI